MLCNKIMLFFIFSLSIWLLSFLLRCQIKEIPKRNITNTELQIAPSKIKIFTAFEEKNDWEAFVLIAKNNIQSCFINIIGGIVLGIATIFNLIFNGFFSADIIMLAHNGGLSIQEILKSILPHSFELIGFWLSGAIGFYIAWNIILFIRGKESFTSLFYKKVGMWTAITFLIILAAAFVEAYISTSI